MLIYPHGLLDGERLSECSDEAQLHFPRLAALANGFGRMMLSQKHILDTAYGKFQRKPTREELTAWLKDYRDHHLLLIYTAEDGTLWGQWCGVPDNALPRYATKADKQSPAPPEGSAEAFEAAYTEVKRQRSTSSEDFLDISETFRTLPKGSEDSKTFPPVVVVVGVVVEEEIQKNEPSAPALSEVPKPKQVEGKAGKFTREDVESIWRLWPNRGSKQLGLRAIEAALRQRARAGIADPIADLSARVRAWLAWHGRQAAAGEFVPAIGYAQGWFGDRKRMYLDPTAEPPAPTLVEVDGAWVPEGSAEAGGWTAMRGGA